MITTLILSAVMAQTPIPKPDSYRTIGTPVWGTRVAITAANTTYKVPITGSTPACFAYRSIVVIKASGGTMACAWADDASVTFTGNVASANACDITDNAGYDGPGACFILSPAERVDQTPWPGGYRLPGARETGICSGTVTAPGGALVYPPCDADADCTGAGISGGTCDFSATALNKRHRAEQGCMFMVCQGDTATTWVYVGVEQ